MERRTGHWWQSDLSNKVIAPVLTTLLLGLLVFVASGKAYEIYNLPPRVDALEQRQPMPADLERDLRAFLQAQKEKAK